MILSTYCNPSKLQKLHFDHFLNNNEFFDCEIDSFPGNEIYYVAVVNKEIVGIRKMLVNMHDFYKDTVLYERFKCYLSEFKDPHYVQAEGVLKTHRNMSIGSGMLKKSMDDIDHKSQIFISLQDSNTLSKKYIAEYGFSELGKTDSRVFLGRL